MFNLSPGYDLDPCDRCIVAMCFIIDGQRTFDAESQHYDLPIKTFCLFLVFGIIQST